MKAKITVIGLGPGGLDDMTSRAKDALRKSSFIVGYNSYIPYIESLTGSDIQIVHTGMRQERARILKAFEIAESGKNVSVISSGDAGIYGIFVLTVASGILAEVLPPFAYYMDMPDTYNHILCLLSSIGLFMLFKDMKSWEGKAAEVIRDLAPYTFGVYLLHEHILVRYRWMHWLGVDAVWGNWKFIPHMIGCVAIVYAAGTVVDWVRAWIFRGVKVLFGRSENGQA